ncbi:MAG: hypothetical protein L6Q76_03545 [Polyangiaceae bacterium]|nr:hypothetical protein [Polyangiaceae bacterium]
MSAFLLLSPFRQASAQPLPDNRYAIDVFQGPILAPIRVTGIAGAYAGQAEGIPGMVTNAAAPAVREADSTNFIELDIAASISIPLSIFERQDFDNSGSIDYQYSDFIYGNLGGMVQVGAIGVGAIGELQRFTLTETAPTGASASATDVTLGKYHVLAAWRLVGDQLMIGTGVRIATLGIDPPESVFTLAGVAVETGLLVRPAFRPFRLGATFRFPVEAELIGEAPPVEVGGVQTAGGLVLPNRVVLPWELEVGVAFQIGSRPLNPAWIDPRDQEAPVRRAIDARRAARRAAQRAELSAIDDAALRALRARAIEADERLAAEEDDRAFERAKRALKRQRRQRYWTWPRPRVLLTAEVLVTGAVSGGVSLEAFLGQNQEAYAGRGSAVGTSGQSVNFSPRFGIETEPILNWVQTRLGSYYEPNRFGGVGRQHFTFGADLRLGPSTWWGLVPEIIYKLQASVDLSPRYESVSFGIGIWR